MKIIQSYLKKSLKSPWFFSAAVVSLFVVITILIYPVFESFLLNDSEFWFTLSDFYPTLLLFGLGVFCVLLLLAFLLPDIGKKLLFGLLFAGTLCAYLQMNFLNPDYGTLDGREIVWVRYGNIPLNTVLWALAIIAIVCVLLFLKNKYPRLIVTALSGLLVAMQTVALLVLLATFVMDASDDKSDQAHVLNRSGINEVSASDNIIFFLVDSFDVQYMQVAAETPWVEGLDDFVFYDNCVGSYSKTFTSVPFLLTGQKYRNEVPVDEYYQNAFTTSSVISTMKEHGYRTDYYTENFKGIVEIADNVGEKSKITTAQAGQVLSLMERLSFFKLAPQMLKPVFYLSTSDFSRLNANEDEVYLINDEVYFAKLKEHGITVSLDERKAMKFIHLNGTHEPHIYTSDVKQVENGDTPDQLGATMNILTTYLDLLRSTGRYDDAMIVIAGDHGHYWTTKPALLIKYPHAKGKFTTSSVPVSHDDIQQTIFTVQGLGTLELGNDIRELTEDMHRDRVFLAYNNDEPHPDGYKPNIWEIYYSDTGFPDQWADIYQTGSSQSVKEFSSILLYDEEIPASVAEDKYLTKGFASWGDALDFDNTWISDQVGGLFFRVSEKPAEYATLHITPAKSAMANTYVTLDITCGDTLLQQEELYEDMPELDINIPAELFDEDGYVFLKFSFSPNLKSTFARWGVDSLNMNTRLDTFLLKSITLTRN